MNAGLSVCVDVGCFAKEADANELMSWYRTWATERSRDDIIEKIPQIYYKQINAKKQFK